MNLHPIFVHFPIALLTIYALLEMASVLKPIRDRAYVFYVKAVLLLVGSAGAIPAYLTGNEQIESTPQGSIFFRGMIVHSHWALATTILFGILSIAYAAAWLTREWTGMPERLKKALAPHRFVTGTLIAPALALIGLGVVTVTGALGGALAYGPDIDPVVSIVYKLLVK